MDVDEAIGKAKKYFYDACSKEELFNVLLEEAHFDHESHVWNITFGFAKADREDGTTGPPKSMEEILGRVYKLVRIDDESGEIEPLQDRFPDGLETR